MTAVSAEGRTLYHLPLSAGSRAVRLALAEKRLAFARQAEPVWERRPAFLELNPAGEVPVLVEHEGATVCGAGVILEYLDEAHAERPLIATAPAERAECRRLADWFARGFHAEVTHRLLNEKVLKRYLRLGHPDSEVIRAGRTSLLPHLEYLAWLAERRRWLAGDELSRADLVAAAELSVVDYLGDVPWHDYGPARDWYAKIKSRPAFRPLLEDYVPGVTPPAHYGDLDF
jgi:glutathione S-transferase